MFSNTCKYGIRAVLYLAAHSNEDHRIGVKDLAKNLDLPKSFLAKVLQKLARGNFISSVKGPGGGFYMNELSKENSLIQVIDLLDGKGSLSRCVLGFPNCSNEKPCALHFQVASFREGLFYQLSNNKIRDLVRRTNFN